MALIVLLLANATLTQVFTADGLRADPRNQRVLLDEYSRQRGQISAGGQLLAYSVSTDGRFRFLRVYPEPARSYAPVTGFYSLQYSSTGLERAEDPCSTAPTSGCSAGGSPTSSPAATRAAATSATTINPQVQQALGRHAGGLQRRPCKGAVVAIEPSTGKILAMVSAPSLRPEPAGRRTTSRGAVAGLAAAARRPGQAAAQPRDLARPTRPARRSR